MLKETLSNTAGLTVWIPTLSQVSFFLVQHLFIRIKIYNEMLARIRLLFLQQPRWKFNISFKIEVFNIHRLLKE
jgi:hypothetical protein